eukprot:scaffold25289_cov142-Cylindrotheca_fusiformis.AAC.1
MQRKPERDSRNKEIAYNSEYFSKLNERAGNVAQWALRVEPRSSLVVALVLPIGKSAKSHKKVWSTLVLSVGSQVNP